MGFVVDVRGDPDTDLCQSQRDKAAVVDEYRDGPEFLGTQADPFRQGDAEAQQHALAVVVDGVSAASNVIDSSLSSGSKVTLIGTT